MFVRYERLISKPFTEVLEPFASSAREWVPEVAKDPASGTSYVLSELGAGPIAKEVKVFLGEASVRPGRAVIPFRLVATGPEGLFPELDANLELLENGEGSKLLLHGTYRLPLGHLGTLLDRKLLHGLRERSLSNFVEMVAAQLALSSTAA